MGPHQPSNLLCSKGHIQAKLKPTEWGKKSLPNFTSAKGLVSRIYKEIKENRTSQK